MIRFTNGSRWRRVEAVNEQTGKLGIAAANYRQRQDAIDGARYVAHLVGNDEMANRIRDARRHRWIDPRHVSRIRRVAADGSVTEQTL